MITKNNPSVESLKLLLVFSQQNSSAVRTERCPDHTKTGGVEACPEEHRAVAGTGTQDTCCRGSCSPLPGSCLPPTDRHKAHLTPFFPQVLTSWNSLLCSWGQTWALHCFFCCDFCVGWWEVKYFAVLKILCYFQPVQKQLRNFSFTSEHCL